MKKILSLCEGRHAMPSEVEGSIFPMELDPTDVAGMDAAAYVALDGADELVLYVTGLSVALVCVINACLRNEIKLTLKHYDRNTESYYEQPVVQYVRSCPFCGAGIPRYASYCPHCGAS